MEESTPLSDPARLATLTVADFSKIVGSVFRAEIHEGLFIELELVKVTQHDFSGATLPQSARAPFSLMFRGPVGVSAPQRIYKLENDELGALEIFLVPMKPSAEGTFFEAVFG